MADDSGQNDIDIERLARFEGELLVVDRDGLADNAYHDARRALLNYLASIGDVDPSGLSLPDMIDAASRFSNAKSVRQAALAVARVAYRDALLPEPTAANKLQRLVVALFEKGLRDVAEKAGVLKASQTFEKYDLIRQIHPRVCAELEPLRNLANAGANHELLVAHKQDFLRLLGKEIVGAYLAPYDAKRLKNALTHVFNELQSTMQLTDATFITRLDGLRDFVDQEMNWCARFPTFLTRDYYLPLLKVFQASLTSIKQDAKDRFVCTIVTKRACPAAAEKRYPLHEVGRVVRIAVPMRNEGPGIAGDLRVDFDVQSNGRVVRLPRTRPTASSKSNQLGRVGCG